MSGQPSPAGIRWNLSLDLLAAVGLGVTVVVVSTLLPTVARKAGIDPLGLAALASAPFIANVLGALSGRYGPRTPRQLALLRAGGAAALAILLVVPSPPIMVAAAVAFWLSIAFGSPLQLRLWGLVYPARVRGRIVGLIGTSRAAASLAGAVAAGVVAASIDGVAIVALGGLIGAAAATAYAGLRAPASDAPSYSPIASIRALTENPVLRRAVLAQALYGGGLIAAAPLYALVYVDRLSLSLSDVALVGTALAVASIGSSIVWGTVSDRVGPRAVLAAGSVFGLVSIVGYTAAPELSVVLLAAVAGGIASPAIELGIMTVVSDNTPLDRRAAAIAGWSALTGLRGFAAPFIGAGLVQSGLLDLTTALAVCSVVSAAGVAVYLNAAGARIPAAAPARVRLRRLVRAARV